METLADTCCGWFLVIWFMIGFAPAVALICCVFLIFKLVCDRLGYRRGIRFLDICQQQIGLRRQTPKDSPPKNIPLPDIPPTNIPQPDIPPTNIPLSDIPSANIPRSDIPSANIPRSDIPPSIVKQPKIIHVKPAKIIYVKPADALPVGHSNKESNKEHNDEEREKPRQRRKNTKPDEEAVSAPKRSGQDRYTWGEGSEDEGQRGTRSHKMGRKGSL